MLPKKVKIVEVGPRDGLQNEKCLLQDDIKIEFINKLSETGLLNIEVGSFVSKDSIPQMGSTAKVLTKINKNSNVNHSVLVPNIQGMEQAIEFKAGSVAVFTAVSDTFCEKNINCNIKQSLNRFKDIFKLADTHSIPVRGYISCVLGCPYEGEIDVNKVADLAETLIQSGCYEISLGDTIGIGNIRQVKELITTVSKKIDLSKIAVHFHDTYGQALVNVYTALEMGVNIVDSSVAGLGGCPYAKGASGNLATEDLLYMLNGLNIETGVRLDLLLAAGNYITEQLNIQSRSKVALALRNK